MIAVKPALIIVSGIHAEEILARVKREIIFRNGVDDVAMPTMEQLRAGIMESPDGLTDIPQFPIFQFIHLPESRLQEPGTLAKAYSQARSQSAIKQTEDMLRFKVDASGVEVFMIFPLRGKEYDKAADLAKSLRVLSGDEVSATRNAIVLVAKNLLELRPRSVRLTLSKLDKAMQGESFPFHRCFFVDEVNEQGQTITGVEELAGLIARYVALMIASEFSSEIRKLAPSYSGQGSGEHHGAYGSFACSTVGFSREEFADYLVSRLSKDIGKRIFAEPTPGVLESDYMQKGIGWFRTYKESMIAQIESADLEREAEDLLLRGLYYKELNELTKRLAAPEIDIDNPSGNSNYREAESQLLEIARYALTKRSLNLNEYLLFLEACLEEGLKAIEDLRQKTKDTKREIADVLIKILCKIKPSEVTLPGGKTQEPNPLKPYGLAVIALSVLFLALKALGVLQLAGEYDYVGAGTLLIIGLVLLLQRGEDKVVQGRTVPIPWEHILKMRQFRFKQFDEKVSILVGLYKRLDWAAMNIKRMEEQLQEPLRFDQRTKTMPLTESVGSVALPPTK